MKLISFLVLACFTDYLVAQIAPSWEGNFEGEILGIASILSGKLNGKEWTATIDASGYPLKAVCTVDYDVCSGTITDEQTQNSSPVKIHLAGSELTLTVHDINPLTGVEEDIPFIFTRNGEAVSQVKPALNTTPLKNADPSKLDRNLLGLWRFTDTYVSGEFSFATDYFMQFNANGSIISTDGRTAGGGPTSSIVSGEPDTHEGIWKAENKTIWTRDANSEWQSYARYYVEGNSMMLTYGNGHKQVWEKISE